MFTDHPWNDPADPVPSMGGRMENGILVFGGEPMKAWLVRQDARRAAWVESPEGIASMAAERTRRELAEVRKRSEELARDADRRGIPDEAGLRAVVMLDGPTETESIRAFRDALAWRVEAQGGRKHGKVPVVLTLSGPPGVGKSCALAWIAARHGPYITAATIVATPRNGWSANEEAWERWLDAGTLCIDEAGCERGDPAPIGYLLSERYNDGKVTLVTSNLGKRDFVKRYCDERLADRLVNGQGRGGEDGGLAWFVTVKGSTLRSPSNLKALEGKEAP